MNTETEYNLTALDITAELIALGLTDMTVISDWCFGLFDDHGNTIELYPTPQENMFRLIWTDALGSDELEKGKFVFSTKCIMASKKGDATKFVEYLRDKHPS